MLPHLNLQGDGDEILAIDDVEREFGVRIDTTNAHNWMTVGDVFDDLLKCVPPEVANEPSTWPRFCRAICEVGSDDAENVEKSTNFIAPNLMETLRAWLSKRFRG